MRLQHHKNRRGVAAPQIGRDGADTFDSNDSPPNIDRWLDIFDRLLQLPAQQKLSIRDELRSHLSERVRDLMLKGADRDVAMRQAINELGEAAELAERFRHANQYPRRRILMNTLLAGVCTTIVIGAVAVMNTSGNSANNVAPAFFAAQADAEDQRELLDSIQITVTTDMTARQIVVAVVATEKIGVSVDWAPLEQIGLDPDQELGIRAKEVSLSMLLNELARRFGNDWGGLDWRVAEGMLILDTKHAFDLRERMIASYDIEMILNRLLHQYGTQYSDATDQIRGVISNLVDPDLWSDNGGDIGKIEVVGGRMFVQAPLRMHEKVSWILGELTKSGSTPTRSTQPSGATGGGAAGGGTNAPTGSGGGGAAGGAGSVNRAEPNIMPNPTDAERAAHARNQKAMVQLRNIHMAVQIWNQSEQQELGNLGQLVAGGMLTKDGLKSPAGPAAEGPDYWIDFGGIIQPGENVDWSKRVVGIDRVMYGSSELFPVLFADGHVEIVTMDRLKALWKDSANDNVAPDLPERRVGAAAQESTLERYPLSYVDAQTIKALLSAVASAEARIECDASTNSVFIAGPANQIEPWTNLIKRLDHAQN